jgi:hypothetical protein
VCELFTDGLKLACVICLPVVLIFCLTNIFTPSRLILGGIFYLGKG